MGIKRRSGLRKDSLQTVLWQVGGGRDSFRDCCQDMAMSPGRGAGERVSGWAVPWRSIKRVNITLGPLPPVISLTQRPAWSLKASLLHTKAFQRSVRDTGDYPGVGTSPTPSPLAFFFL